MDRRLAYILAVAAGNAKPPPESMTDEQLGEARVWTRQRVEEARATVRAGQTPPATLDALLRAQEALDGVWRKRGPTLREARAEVEAKLRDGSTCPCCGRLAKLYRRNFSSLMAATAVWLVRMSQQHRASGPLSLPGDATPVDAATARSLGWVRWAEDGLLNPTVYRFHEISRVVLFGLAEEGAWPGGSGWYRPTPLAEVFVMNGGGVPKAIETYNDAVLATDPQLVYVTDLLEGFDRERLMVAALDDAAAWEIRRARGTPAE